MTQKILSVIQCNQLKKFFVLLCVFFTPQSSYAEIVLTKVPNWSARVLSSPKDIHIRPADSLHGPLVTSILRHEVLVTQSGSLEPVLHFLDDSTAPYFQRVHVDNFGDDPNIYVLLTSNGVFEGAQIRSRVLTINLSNPLVVDSIGLSLSAGIGCCGTGGRDYLAVSPLETQDINADGVKELLLGYDWWERNSDDIFRSESTLKGLLQIYSNPQTIMKTISSPIYTFKNLESNVNVVISKYYYSLCGHGVPDGCYISEGVQSSVWNNLEHLRNIPVISHPDCVCDGFTPEVMTGGDMIPENNGIELLMKYTKYRYNSYSMLSINENGSLDTIWSDTLLGSRNLHRFASDPNDPSALVALTSRYPKVFRVDNKTGQIIDSSHNSILGIPLKWIDLFNDGKMVLPVWEGDSIVAYQFDFATDVGSENEVPFPHSFNISEPFPNPFNPSVYFTVSLAQKSQLKLTVYNILGRKVEVLFDSEISAGTHTFTWNGSNNASGVYFARAVTNNGHAQSKKMILLK